MKSKKNLKKFFGEIFNIAAFTNEDDEDVLDKGQYKLKIPLSYVPLTKEGFSILLITFIVSYFNTKENFSIIFAFSAFLEIMMIHYFFIKTKDSEIETLEIFKYWYDLKKKYMQGRD